MLSLASASLSFQASAPLTAPNTLARRANVVARDQDQIGFQNPDQLRSDAASAKSSGEFCYGLVGTVAPFEEGFDPFNLSPGASYDQVRTWREAELAHGRVGMLASAGFIVQEKFHPLFSGDGGPAIDQIPQLPVWLWAVMAGGIGAAEFARINIGWAEVDGAKGKAESALKADYYPGDLSFDPLGLKPEDPEEFRLMQEKELAHCRLAMIAAAGFLAQEAVSGETWGTFWGRADL